MWRRHNSTVLDVIAEVGYGRRLWVWTWLVTEPECRYNEYTKGHFRIQWRWESFYCLRAMCSEWEKKWKKNPLNKTQRAKNEIELETTAIGSLCQVKFCYFTFCGSGMRRGWIWVPGGRLRNWSGKALMVCILLPWSLMVKVWGDAGYRIMMPGRLCMAISET
jgi:hypothetical protein